ncbi:S26 family signal peptidase [Catellatospora sp. NPDC049609]|uniref:S26 family signal peptidase n=1 Tax=Catellatospora sp. NPDC049609 TaxID=3155505 RepID=UPI003443B4D8
MTAALPPAALSPAVLVQAGPVLDGLAPGGSVPGGLVPVCLVAAGLALVTLVCVARVRLVRVTVSGGSMAPTLAHGDRLLMVRRRVRARDRGAVVLLAAPEDATAQVELGPWRVKRLVALPGDPVPAVVAAARGLPAGGVVPPGEILVLGDNPRSEDSRHWHRVPIALVTAVARRSPPPPGRAGARKST